MNINNLQVQLQTAVENAAAEATTDGTSATLYYLQLAKAIQALNMGQIRTVATEASLPAAASNTGWLIFVTAEERLYFSNGTVWATIVPIVYNNSAWTWGSGVGGALGDNTLVSKSSPVSVVGGFTDWCQVSVGGNQPGGAAVRQNGTAWAWGYGGQGRLGDNTVANKSSPVSVVGGFTDWCQVSVSTNIHQFTLAVRQNGTAWGWGNNCNGRLGDNTTVSKSSPVSVVGGFTDWCQVGAGANHALAVRQNGTVWAWGDGGNGQLGDNTTGNKSSPVSVVGGFTDWCHASGGIWHSIAIRQNGTVWSWGSGTQGRLGDNTASAIIKPSPVSVVGGFTDWCRVSAGRVNSLGIRTNGTAWAWGGNCAGQLGDNTTVNKSSPVSVVGGFTNWCQVSGGNYHSLGLRQNGTAWAWGTNACGQLGDNTVVSKSSPVSVVGGYTDWCQVSAGYGMSAGIRTTAT
jgi:alpha-tubulin suppressor-like RCC1 family protein